MSQFRPAGLALASVLTLIGASSALAQTPPATTAAPPRPTLQFDRTPTGADVGRFYPTRAQFEGVQGRAVIGCEIGAEGNLQGCILVSETPPEYGFGAAVLGMSNLFHVNMRTATPGMRIRLPMGFQVPAGETPTAPAPAGALVNPPWSASPTQAELTAGAPVSREGGRAIMDCVFTAEGTLSACAVASQVPAAGGFGDAALAMAPRYRVAAIGADGIAVVGRPVRLAVIFPRNAGRR